MRLAALALAAVLLPAALAADAPSARGTAYVASDLEALFEGLGYETRAMDGGGRYLRMERPGYALDVHAVVAADGGSILLYAPLREWPDTLTPPESVLTGLLRKSGELGPSRFYLAKSTAGHWVGLLRSVDNHGVLPRHVRENLDLVFDHARAAESLWNPERWPSAAGAPAPAMGG